MSIARPIEGFIASFALIAGTAFLLKMCYLSLVLNTAFAILFLTLFYFYLRMRYQVIPPLRLLVLVFAALQVDALGNYFRMYGRAFGPLQYDEFSHLTIQILVTPIIFWLVDKTLKLRDIYLPPRLLRFFSAASIFSLCAFYEIIELWDELYFNGHRIWSTHDTATDLQWDLVGILIGTLISSVALRERLTQPQESGVRSRESGVRASDQDR